MGIGSDTLASLKVIYNPAQMKLFPDAPFHVFTLTSPVTEYNGTGGDGIRFSTLGFYPEKQQRKGK